MGLTPKEAVNRLLQLETEGRPLAIVMAGLPGSGKSTVTKELTSRSPVNYVTASTDDMVDQAAAASGSTYSETFPRLSFKDLNRRFKEVIRSAAETRQSLIIDRVNARKKSRRSFIELLGQSNHLRVCVVVNTSQEATKERLRARGETTGKWIPEYVSKSMLESWQTPTKDEGFDVILNVDN